MAGSGTAMPSRKLSSSPGDAVVLIDDHGLFSSFNFRGHSPFRARDLRRHGRRRRVADSDADMQRDCPCRIPVVSRCDDAGPGSLTQGVGVRLRGGVRLIRYGSFAAIDRAPRRRPVVGRRQGTFEVQLRRDPPVLRELIHRHGVVRLQIFTGEMKRDDLPGVDIDDRGAGIAPDMSRRRESGRSLDFRSSEVSARSRTTLGCRRFT